MERRPGVGPEAPNKNIADTPIVPDAAPRCASCGHRLTLAESIAAGLGPVCAARLSSAQLDARRTAVGATLAALQARLGGLDVRGLAVVLVAVEDALEALDAGVTP